MTMTCMFLGCWRALIFAQRLSALEMKMMPTESVLLRSTLEIASLGLIDCPPIVPLTLAEPLPPPPPPLPLPLPPPPPHAAHAARTIASIPLRMDLPPSRTGYPREAYQSSRKAAGSWLAGSAREAHELVRADTLLAALDGVHQVAQPCVERRREAGLARSIGDGA